MTQVRHSGRSGSLYRRIFRKPAENYLQYAADKRKQAKELEKLQEQQRLLAKYSTDTVYRLRYEDMRYDFISPNVTKLLGYTPEEMQQLSFRDLILETRLVDDGLRQIHNFESFEQARKDRQVLKWQADYQMRTKSGYEIWVSDISYPWLNERGDIIGSVGSLRDITNRVEAEAVMREELVRLANTDALTGLHNRRVFFERLEQEIKRQRRAREDMAVCIIDVDQFKRINDAHGHYAGDQILAQIAAIMQSCLRETDLCARLGGEEFAILLPDTSASGAYWVAERIREEVARYNFTVGENQVPIACTVSAGIAGLPLEEQISATELYKLADTRLYIAKHTGRNQVSVDEILSLH